MILSTFSNISQHRKLLEQREEELQQQVRSLRLKEATMSRTNAELSHRAQQQDTRLSILEAELSKAREQVESNSTPHATVGSVTPEAPFTPIFVYFSS